MVWGERTILFHQGIFKVKFFLYFVVVLHIFCFFRFPQKLVKESKFGRNIFQTGWFKKPADTPLVLKGDMKLHLEPKKEILEDYVPFQLGSF